MRLRSIKDHLTDQIEKLQAQRIEYLAELARLRGILITGFYLWFSSLKIRIGGSEAEDTYPGTIHSFAGIALFFARLYQVRHTLQGIKRSTHGSVDIILID